MTYYNRGKAYLPRGAPNNWNEGDIAFLKPAHHFNSRDYQDLFTSGYVPENATTHPVIILTVKNKKAIITTVSAYSTEQNNHLAPWDQKWHRAKNPAHFRAFGGSRSPQKNIPYLRLASPQMRMPKPQASWVYIKNFFCVPFSVLGRFDKSPTLLRVHPESLCQLKTDMRAFGQLYNDAGMRLNNVDGPATATITTTTTIALSGARAPSRGPEYAAPRVPVPACRNDND